MGRAKAQPEQTELAWFGTPPVMPIRVAAQLTDDPAQLRSLLLSVLAHCEPGCECASCPMVRALPQVNPPAVS